MLLLTDLLTRQAVKPCDQRRGWLLIHAVFGKSPKLTLDLDLSLQIGLAGLWVYLKP